jgi:hypothetical protein
MSYFSSLPSLSHMWPVTLPCARPAISSLSSLTMTRRTTVARTPTSPLGYTPCRSSPVPSVAVPSPAMLRCGCLHRASSILHHGRAPPSSRRLTSPRCRSADPQAGVKRVAAGIEILCGLVAKAHRRWVKSGGGKLWRCRRERLE